MTTKDGRGRTGIVAAVGIVLACAAACAFCRGREPPRRDRDDRAGAGATREDPLRARLRDRDRERQGAARARGGDGGRGAALEPVVLALGDGGVARDNRVIARATWGGGPGQLGRDLPREGNAEGPMSMAVDPSGRILVLDQVNHRIVRYGADGGVESTMRVDLRAPQDIAVAGDGALAVLDRLGDRAVSVVGPDGRERGRIPLEGRGISEGGAVTALVVDGNNVYAEREHGPLVRVGDTSGRPAPEGEREEIPGRPTRDGLSYIGAGLIDAPAGRFWVNSIDRATRDHRFTRELRLDIALVGIVLLDTDRAGTIYVAVLGHGRAAGEGDPPMTARLLCLEPLSGRALGMAPLPVNSTPEETFRDMVVLDDGGVVYSVRTDQGVTLQRFDCR